MDMKKMIFTLASAILLFASCNSIKEPEYRDIQDIKIINIGMLESTASLDMLYYNPNGFGVQLTEASGEVYVDTTYFGRFTMDQEVRVAKHAEFIVPALFKIDMISALKNGQEIISKKEAMVKIHGNAKVKKAGVLMNVPIRFEGMQNIEKLRQLLYK